MGATAAIALRAAIVAITREARFLGIAVVAASEEAEPEQVEAPVVMQISKARHPSAERRNP